MIRLRALALRVAVLLSPVLATSFLNAAESSSERFDILIKGGTLYDGTGKKPQVADVAISADRIAGIGSYSADKAAVVVDAKGLAVAPGFINMLSWSTDSLIEDGLSQSEIRQGVTTEIMGEGFSMGPCERPNQSANGVRATRHQI
jgi:N-acyl-D-amino-acid deacylase